jgi:hypothetical protein
MEDQDWRHLMRNNSECIRINNIFRCEDYLFPYLSHFAEHLPSPTFPKTFQRGHQEITPYRLNMSSISNSFTVSYSIDVSRLNDIPNCTNFWWQMNSIIGAIVIGRKGPKYSGGGGGEGKKLSQYHLVQHRLVWCNPDVRFEKPVLLLTQELWHGFVCLNSGRYLCQKSAGTWMVLIESVLGLVPSATSDVDCSMWKAKEDLCRSAHHTNMGIYAAVETLCDLIIVKSPTKCTFYLKKHYKVL